MPSTRTATGALLLCLAGTLAGLDAAAAPNDAGQQRQAAAATSPAYVGGLGQAVSAATLDSYSGGTSVRNNQNLNGTVSNNSATRVNTGSNAISANSFSGATGLPTVIQNTGNNVLIQNGVIVNVQFKP
ncbi:hypothetical protein ABQJ54_03205 [Rhodanobacter sp. Si-c]|uniref:Uncharacterized protein n=1 Tax=Rhodanobacter lycopersici TaxID=3162487 RepID=A0ABV3QAQ2_9GAMM